MACSLPAFILLKSNTRGKYLRYRKENDSNHSFLQFSVDQKEENVEIQYVKFEVQKSETMEGFVHIKSCYNNKYWVRKSGDEGKSWIAVESNEAEEDSSKLSCTLFKPVLVDADVDQDLEFVEHKKSQKIRLVHVDQIGRQGCVAPTDSDLLILQDEDTTRDVNDEVFMVYDAASTFLLPNRVAFTNHEGKYGSVTTVNWDNFVDFKTSDIGTSGVAIQLSQFPLQDPPYFEANHMSYGYWTIDLPGISNVVLLLKFPLPLNPKAYMTPIRLGGNNIALKSINRSGQLANCGSSNINGLEHVLGVSATSISESAIFGVEEPVMFRAISNVEYNLTDSRVYNISSVDKFRDERRNNTSVEQTGTFSVAYTTSQTSTWSDTVSVTTTISASMSVSIPFVGVGFGIELSQESSKTVTFGKEETDSNTITYQQTVTIPPGKKVTLLVVATRAQCDVPFSCHVVDTLTNADIEEYTKTDGLFTGANEFSFQTDLLEENL